MMVKIEIDSDDVAYILDALSSGAARLKGVRIDFCDNRQMHTLNHAHSILKEAAENAEEQE